MAIDGCVCWNSLAIMGREHDFIGKGMVGRYVQDCMPDYRDRIHVENAIRDVVATGIPKKCEYEFCCMDSGPYKYCADIYMVSTILSAFIIGPAE